MINPFLLDTHKDRLVNDAVINFTADFTNNNHIYCSRKVERYLSITTLLKEMGISPSYDGVNEEVLNKAKDYGEMVHSEIEAYCKFDEIGIADELQEFIKWSKKNKINYAASEYRVHDERLAGSIDLIYMQNGKLVISDIKTTSQVHKDSVSWQLSLYRYLLKENIEKATCIHIRPDLFEIIDIPLKSDEECKKLIDCYFNDKVYEVALLEQEQINALFQLQAQLKNVEDVKKQLENKIASFKSSVLKEMDQRGLIKVELENDGKKLTITKVSPKDKETIDYDKLLKDNPTIDIDKYKKQTPVKPYVLISGR